MHILNKIKIRGLSETPKQRHYESVCECMTSEYSTSREEHLAICIWLRYLKENILFLENFLHIFKEEIFIDLQDFPTMPCKELHKLRELGSE